MSVARSHRRRAAENPIVRDASLASAAGIIGSRNGSPSNSLDGGATGADIPRGPECCDDGVLARSFACNVDYIYEFALRNADKVVTLTAYRHPFPARRAAAARTGLE